MFIRPLHILGHGCIIALLLTSLPSQAHFYPETANCRAPTKPLEFVTELDEQAFEAKVAEYRSCLEGFVEKQNESMGKHQSAAEQAAAQWKAYVENVLGSSLTETPK